MHATRLAHLIRTECGYCSSPDLYWSRASVLIESDQGRQLLLELVPPDVHLSEVRHGDVWHCRGCNEVGLIQ